METRFWNCKITVECDLVWLSPMKANLQNGWISLPIILSESRKHQFSAIITHELEPEIYSIKGLNAFLKNCWSQSSSIHINWMEILLALGLVKTIQWINLKIKKQHYCFVKVSYPIWDKRTTWNQQEFAFSQIELYELSSRLISELDINR
jgi:alanine racemase